MALLFPRILTIELFTLDVGNPFDVYQQPSTICRLVLNLFRFLFFLSSGFVPCLSHSSKKTHRNICTRSPLAHTMATLNATMRSPKHRSASRKRNGDVNRLRLYFIIHLYMHDDGELSVCASIHRRFHSNHIQTHWSVCGSNALWLDSLAVFGAALLYIVSVK